MSINRKRIVVIGGGINGLAAAWSAWEASGQGPVDVVLLEASSQIGGKARSRKSDGWLFEEGPTGFLEGDEALQGLIERSGLDAIPANQLAARRYVVRGGRTREMVMKPFEFALSGILSPGGILRMLREPWIPKGDSTNESIWDFAARRLGPQVADRLIAPMTLGVFAGDSHNISLPAAFPLMAELERRHGSLFRALLAKFEVDAEKGGVRKVPGKRLCSFKDGMQSLPIALADQAPFEVRVNAAVVDLRPNEGAWELSVEGFPTPLHADAVVLSCDAHTSAKLLGKVLPVVSEELAGISIPGMSVVGLGFTEKRAINRLPTGFGVLIPRDEGFRTLGCLFDAQLFLERAPEGQMLVRCMIGGATDSAAATLTDNELLGIAIDDVKRLFGIQDNPSVYEIARWRGAIPQYELGHMERVHRIDAELGRFAEIQPGLHLAGCHARGVAFGKTAAEGWRVGELAAEAL
ncbi:MAG: oxygen-dependent protoporphyrinogen oxidase [Planctomycetota bacterium]